MLPALVLSASLALAAAAPYPALYYPDTGEVVYRVPRQISRADDLLTAADTGYAAPGPVSQNLVNHFCNDLLPKVPVT